MHPTLTIAQRDLRARLRDRTALLVAFIAPLALATILSAALGGTREFSMAVAVADLDGGPVAEAFVQQALGSPAMRSVLTVQNVGDEAAVRAALDEGTASAGYVIPPGFSSAATNGRQTSITVLRHADAQFSGDLAESVAGAFSARLEAQTRAVAVAVAAESDLRLIPQIVAEAGRQPPALTLDTIDFSSSRANAASYFGPSMAVFFVFFVVALGPAGLLRQRRQGTLARLHAAPIPPWTILAGVSLSILALAALSMAVMWAVTSLAFDATWGDPVGVVLLCAAVVLAATGITAMIATLARTDQQVDGWTSIVVFSLALLGGSFSNIADMPVALQRVAQLTPNGWAMRGFVDLAAGVPASGILGAVWAVAAFGVATLLIAAVRARRLVQP